MITSRARIFVLEIFLSALINCSHWYSPFNYHYKAVRRRTKGYFLGSYLGFWPLCCYILFSDCLSLNNPRELLNDIVKILPKSYPIPAFDFKACDCEGQKTGKMGIKGSQEAR